MNDGELVLSRVLEAPRALVWKVWTDPSHLAKWWGPAGFAMKVARLDLRIGGVFHYAMTPPGSGQPMWGKFTYDEIHPFDRLVFRSSFSDEKEATTPNPWNSVWPLEIRNVLTLTEVQGKTTLTLVGTPHNATPEGLAAFAENKSNVQKGFAGTFAQLEAYLADQLVADRAFIVHRTFNAPRELVWKAWTQPSRIAAWWGPSGFGNTIKTMDVKPGGNWLFTMHGPDGTDYPNKVSYLEVEEPSKLVYDHGEEGEPGFFHVTVTFTENQGKTDLVYRMVFPTAEAKRLSVEKYGAAEGLKQNMDRFADYLTKEGLVVTRVFQAPRAAVWKAWTDPAQIQKWWGPERFTCPGAQIDLRIGGRYLLGMKGPDGQEFWSTGEYRQIILNQKLVYSDHFSDAEGKVVPAASLGLPGDWKDQTVTVTFAELGKSKTLVTVHQEFLPDEWRDMTQAGWSTSLNKLAQLFN